MTIRCGKYFYQVEHQKPSLLDLPAGCNSVLKNKDDVYDFDFNKFKYTGYQSGNIRSKMSIKNQNSNNFNNDYTKNPYRKKQSYFNSNLNGLNFDYNNLQIESNYDTGNSADNDRYNRKSEKENFFSNKISMEPPKGDSIFNEGNNNYNADRNNSNRNNFNNDKYTNNNYTNSNYNNYKNDTYSSNNYNNYNNDNYTNSHRKGGNSDNYNSIRSQYNIDRQPKVSSIEHYDYQSKTSSAYPNNTQTSRQTHQSQTSNKYSSNVNLKSGSMKSNNINQNAYSSKPSSSSKVNQQSTANPIFTSKGSASSKTGSTSYNSNTLENNKYSKKAPVYDYSKPIPSGTYDIDSSSRSKSYKTSAPSTSTTSVSSNINSRNNYGNSNYPPSMPSSSTASISAKINSRNNYNVSNQPPPMPSTSATSVSTKINSRNDYNVNHQHPSMPSTTTTSSSRSKYTSTSSRQSTNIPRGSTSSYNQNTKFTTTSDLLNQRGSSIHSDASQSQYKTRTSIHQQYNDDIRPANLTQYVRPKAGKSSTVTNETITTTTTTTNTQNQFIAHQMHYNGNQDAPSNPPSALLAKKNAISHPDYDFLQPNQHNFSQDQSLSMNEAYNNDSITVDPVPKKTRVEFPEPQTAPKPFQMIDMNLEGEVSQEEVQKVEDLNELMKSFNADSDNETEINDSKFNNDSKNKPLIKAEDLKKGLFSSSDKYLEEEEEMLELDIQDENEKNNQPLEDLSIIADIEKKSKDFDDQNFDNIEFEEEDKMDILLRSEEDILSQQEDNFKSNDEEIKSENASGEETPNNSSLPKEQANFRSTEAEEEEELIEDDALNSSTEIRNIIEKFKKSIGEEGLEEDTQELIRHLEEEDTLYNEIKQNQQINDNGEKTIEDPFYEEEEENESMIEKVNANIDLSDDETTNFNNDKSNETNNIKTEEEEEEESITYSIGEILKKVQGQNFFSDEIEEEEEEEGFIDQENKTPFSHFKKPLQFVSQNLKNRYTKSNNGAELAFDFADKLLKIQLRKILFS